MFVEIELLFIREAHIFHNFCFLINIKPFFMFCSSSSFCVDLFLLDFSKLSWFTRGHILVALQLGICDCFESSLLNIIEVSILLTDKRDADFFLVDGTPIKIAICILHMTGSSESHEQHTIVDSITSYFEDITELVKYLHRMFFLDCTGAISHTQGKSIFIDTYCAHI